MQPARSPIDKHQCDGHRIVREDRLAAEIPALQSNDETTAEIDRGQELEFRDALPLILLPC